jgi:methionyl-tRNA formyltransferase
MLSFGILASGNLGYHCLERLKINISFVLTDSNSDSIIKLAIDKNIPLFQGNPRNGALKDFLHEKPVDVIFSINYLFLVEDDIINHAKKYCINFHGSLLPKYRGRTPHVWAIINNESVTGITAHFITKECDEGDIVYQKPIYIEQSDTGGGILRKYYLEYPAAIDEVINKIEAGTISSSQQDSTKATFFPKRTPNDGEINWSWQKERIYNWVRAQCKPYPGAFTFYKDYKIVIHRIEYDDFGYHDKVPNGTILNHDQDVIIKTPNGAVRLKDFEIEQNIYIEKGETFHNGRYTD